MGSMRNVSGWLFALGLLAACLPGVARAQGLLLPGGGAMHRSMGGASTAGGVDALGAMYWNPAAIRSVKGSQVVIGGEAIIGDTHVGSFVPAGPRRPFAQSGYTRSDSGVAPVTGLAVVYQEEDSPISFGTGLITLAGATVNFPGDPNNPILAPVGPGGRFVLGPQSGSITALALTPTFAYQLGERLVVGAGPMVDIAVVSLDPALFGPVNDANGDGVFSFALGSHTRPFWGGGFRAGAVYQISDHLSAGVSYQSPQWFETWRFNAANEVGQPFTFTTQFSLPTIISAGLSYSGIERLVLSADVRWFDYQTTKLLGQPVIQGGANWQSIWAVAVGGKYQLTERLSLQAGYIYNENPVPSQQTVFNTLLPALIQHTVSVGAYFQLNEWIGMSSAYIHGFKNSISGSPIQLVNSTTNLDTEYDSFAFGLHIKFGGCCPKPREDCACEGGYPVASAPAAPAYTGMSPAPVDVRYARPNQ